MKPFTLAAAAFFMASTCACAQNSNLPQVQNSYMSGSSSRSAYQQQQQRQMQLMQMQQMQGQRQGAGAGRANLGQTYGNQVGQQQQMPAQQQVAPPMQYSNGLPQVRTSRYCGMPGQDMLNNNVRSAAQQARQPRPVPKQQVKPAAPQGPTYSYEGGYDYKGK
jgi:hypothetical protein